MKYLKKFESKSKDKKSKSEKEAFDKMFLSIMSDGDEECEFYRGVGLDEAIKACKAGHLIYLSKDPMSRDWEVIEYSMGDAASEASDQDIEDFVESIVPWEDNGKGVNLTNDLENAKGYSPIVLGVEVIGDYAEFSHAHFFARYPEECIVKSVYYKGKQMTPEQFLLLHKKKNRL